MMRTPGQASEYHMRIGKQAHMSEHMDTRSGPHAGEASVGSDNGDSPDSGPVKRAPKTRRKPEGIPNPYMSQANPKGSGRRANMEQILNRGRTHAEQTKNQPPSPRAKGAYMGLAASGERGVTAKQDKFAYLVAQGNSLSDSYRQAYSVENMLPETVRSTASKLAAVPHVAARITYHVEAIERERPHDDAATRRMVREYLVGVVQDREAKTSDRTRAAELLGKVAGVALFSEQKANKADVPASHAEFNLLLSRLLELVEDEALEPEGQSPFGDRTDTEGGGLTGEVED